MRIATYNVLGLRGYPPETAAESLEGEGTVEHFSDVFTQLECDVVALEEGIVDGRIQRIARRMGRHLATFPSPIAWPGHVLSHYPILESRVFSHAVPGEEVPPLSRTAGAALLQVTAGMRLWITVLHLHPGSEEMRSIEADIVWSRLGELLGVCENAVVLGDFNCPVEERLHRHLKDMHFTNVMEAVGGGIELTMDTAGVGKHAIDHIYVSPSLKKKLRKGCVVRDEGFRQDDPPREGMWVHSDHLPVVAELDIVESESEGE